MERLLNYIMQQFVDKKIIDQTNDEVYRFGLRRLLVQPLHMVVIVAMGAYMELLQESLIFLCAYTLLRVNAGGYHAVDTIGCFLITIIMDGFVLFMIKLTPPEFLMQNTLWLWGIAVFVIWRYAPVDSAAKSLDILEKRIYRKRSIWIMAGISIGLIFCLLLRAMLSGYVLSLALFMVAITLLAGAFKEQRLHRKQ